MGQDVEFQRPQCRTWIEPELVDQMIAGTA
jgi:hypothetical protein